MAGRHRSRFRSVPALAGAALIGLLCAGAPASGQLLGLEAGSGDQPLEIEAREGIEWLQDLSLVRARGDARARRGDVEVRADTLSAYYRDEADGEMTIWRLDADGDVKITSPEQTAFAQQGTYDVDQGILVLSGGDPVRVAGNDGEVTARGQMEYWERQRMLVARGDARARQGDDRIAADVLVAYLAESGEGAGAIERVEAFDAVRIDTEDGVVRADRGTYVTSTEVATLTGNVRITRGENQLNGCRAEVNMKTGMSRLFGCGAPVAGFVRPDEAGETVNRP